GADPNNEESAPDLLQNFPTLVRNGKEADLSLRRLQKTVRTIVAINGKKLTFVSSIAETPPTPHGMSSTPALPPAECDWRSTKEQISPRKSPLRRSGPPPPAPHGRGRYETQSSAPTPTAAAHAR